MGCCACRFFIGKPVTRCTRLLVLGTLTHRTLLSQCNQRKLVEGNFGLAKYGVRRLITTQVMLGHWVRPMSNNFEFFFLYNSRYTACRDG